MEGSGREDEKIRRPSTRARRGTGPAAANKSIVEGYSLLAALAEAPGPLHLGDLAARTGLNTTKVFRYLSSYLAVGLVEQKEDSGRYGLGPSALSLGLAAVSKLQGIQVATEGLVRISEEIGIDGFLATWHSTGPVVIRTHYQTVGAGMRVSLGSSPGMFRSSTGRLFVAYMPEAETQAAVAAEIERLSKTEGRQLSELEGEFRSLIEEVRIHGLSATLPSQRPNFQAISGPVFDGFGDIAYALTLFGVPNSFDMALNGPVASAFRAALKDLSARMGAAD